MTAVAKKQQQSISTALSAVSTVFSELINGTAPSGGWVLNPNDIGILRSLERLTHKEASLVASGGGASIAAHVDHLCYGLNLLNRWGAGEQDPFSGANYRASWDRQSVTESEWTALRKRLQDEAMKWSATLQTPRELNDTEMNGIVSSAAHLAYHLGAIRQINRSTRGPSAND